MPAQYTIGQVLPNGATVTADTFKVLPDGSTFELMVDSARNETTIQIPAPGSTGANEQTIRQQAVAAFIANRTFVAIASPTNAQVVAQTKALSRQVNGIMRLMFQQFDGTD